MREKFVLCMNCANRTTKCLTSVILALVFLFFGNAQGQGFNCATWGDEKTQLIQLTVGESKTFQLPTASVDSNGASCVDDADDIQYEVRRSSDPVLPRGFTFDPDDVTVSGCSTEVVTGYKFSLVATGPDACSCTPATLEVVFRNKDDDDDDNSPVCPTTGTPPVEDSVDLDQTPPQKPFYGWSQVHLGGRWIQPVGKDESEQGAMLTYGARCTGKYDLAENYIGGCPAFLSFIGQAKFDNGIVYFTESISKNRDDIGIYRIRITAHKEDVATTSQTTVVLEVVDDHPAPDSLVVTAPALQTLHLAWEVDEDEREYITGFDLEFRKVLSGGKATLYELATTVTSLTVGSLETDTQYQARLRIRGGRWSDWVQIYTLGNNAPTFEKTEYRFTLTENVSGRGNRIRLGTVEATDPNPQDSVTYSLDSADSDRFTIGESSGILYYTGDGEDHEATPTINVKVTATGGTGVRKLESSVMVTVEVTNVSEPLAFADDAKIKVDDLTLGDYVDIQLPLAIGGDGPVNYSVDPDLPASLEIERRTGKLKGTATVTTKRSTYTYTATDAEGETDSLTFSFRVFGKAPKAPINLSVQRAHADRITIRWENVSTPFVPVVEHEIEYRVKGTSRWKRKRIDAPATSYTITGLKRNTTYQIRVKNFAESGHVGFSSILEAETRTYATPSAPRNVSVVEAGSNSLSIEWDEPADNGGRRVVVYDVRYRKKGAETWMEEEARTTSFTITGLEQGTEYLIGVRAVNVAGAGQWSDDLSASTIKNSLPIFSQGASIPNQSYKVGEAAATIELPSASEGDGYLVYSLSPALPPGIRFNPNVRTISGTPTVTQSTTTYTYTVADSDEFTKDDESHLTFEITVAANTPLAPSLTIEEISYESVQFSWAMPDARGSTITSYDVELREIQQQSSITQHDATTTRFTATNLQPQTRYEVRIRAVNNIGPSDWSGWMEFTTAKVPVEIRSRPLIHALGVAGTMLGEGAAERIGNRANQIDATQRETDEGYTPPYYFSDRAFTLVSNFNGFSPMPRLRDESRSSVDSYSRLLSMLPRSANFVLNNSNGSTDAENGFDWAAWASFDTTQRDANTMDVVDKAEVVSSLEAQTTSIWFGAEFEVAEDVRLGIAVSQATGDVDIDRLQSGAISDTEQDNVEFSLTSLHPYAAGKLHEQLRVWGTLGRGTGSTTLTDRWGEIDDLGLTATVLAAGVHFNFDDNGENGIALKGDLFQSDIDTDDSDDFEGSLSNSVRRLRVGIQGRRHFKAEDLDLVLTGEFLGRFENGGVADGTNIDIGGQVDIFFTNNWSASGQLRVVRSMESDAYQALGIQFDLRRESAADGSGLSFQFSPAWGNSSLPERSFDLNLPLHNSFNSNVTGLRSEVEISYGIWSDRRGLIEPYGAVARLNQLNQLTLGVRLSEAHIGLGRVLIDISSFASKEDQVNNSGMVIAGRITF